MRSIPKRSKRSGGALIICLAVMVGLVSIVVGFAATQRSHVQSLQRQLDRDRARLAAEAALERVLAEMVNVDANAVTLNDEWAQLGEYTGENYLIGNGTARVEIVDEGAFINLNTADEEQLLNLGLTQEQVDSLLDWREAGANPRPEGAKDEFYNGLAQPYNTALRPLRTIDELLLIKGFEAGTLYELPEERQSTQQLVQGGEEEQPVLINLATVWSSAPFNGSNGQARLNVNTATAQQLIQRGLAQQLAQAIILRRNTQGTFTSLGQVLAVPGVTLQNAPAILDNLTINAQTVVSGRLNLNTVKESCLNSIPGITPDISSAIVSRQQQGFASLGEITAVPGITLQFLEQHADKFVTGSNAFRVRIVGRYGSSRSAFEAVVRIEESGPRVLGIFEPAFEEMETRWEWSEETTTDITLAEVK